MEYKKGDKVRFKDAAGIAVVSRIVGNIIYIEDDAGFEHEYESHELLPFRTLEIGDVPIKDKKETPRAVSAQQISRLTIDLHSHVLLENTYGMTKYEILNYQLDKARQTINEAKRRKINKVLIIHGIGSGRLKDEVHHMLSKIGKLNYYFADFADGGYGATEVEILLSKH
jgi:dsDNA-specific endonuclease/ATPase MutS2